MFTNTISTLPITKAVYGQRDKSDRPVRMVSTLKVSDTLTLAQVRAIYEAVR